MGFISKHITNILQTNPLKTTTRNLRVKAMISMDYRGFGLYLLV